MSDDSGTPTSAAAHFSSIAEAYQRYWSNALLPATRQLVAALPLESARSVLDIGAGIGSSYPLLVTAAPGARIVLTDPADGMLRLAPAEAGRAQAVAGRLPFRDGSFDVALMAFMLQYVPDARHTLAEVRRVLRPGGHVGMACWGATSESVAEQAWTAALDAAGAPLSSPLPTYYEATDSLEKLRTLLEGCGYEDIEVRVLPWSDHPDLDTFLGTQQVLGASGRRLAGWDPARRADFLVGMRRELADLPVEAFLDDSEVLAATARRP